MAQIVSAKLKNRFNALELRILVLASLFLQIVLIATGSRRKYTRKKRVAATLWLAYLSADFVATTSLGFLSRAKENNDPRDAIRAFWAPFLLMHLGGPDTITAYALEDNEFWLRRALEMGGQVLLALYVLIRSWTSTPVNYLSIVVFVAGLIKYGERTCVLFLASRDQFRESIATPPNPGPNYAKLSDELVSKELEGYKVSVEKYKDNISSSSSYRQGENVGQGSLIKDAPILHDAYYFYGTFKKLFADLVLSLQDRRDSLSFFNSDIMQWDRAFSIVEVELGLVYDLFYTKAFVLYSRHGLFLRLVSFSCTVVSLILFVIIHLNVYPKLKLLVGDNGVSVSLKTEVIITYVLLVGAILLEIYAVMILVSSDRMMIWLSGRKFKTPIFFAIFKTVSLLRYLHIVPAEKRWSNVMGQYNFVNCCFESKPKCAKLHDYLKKKYFFWKSECVPKGLKALIFKELKNRAKIDVENLGSYRGDMILLREMKYFGEDDKDQDVEFDRSLLLLHMATDLCYYKEVGENHEPDKTWLRNFIPKDDEDPSSEENRKFKREICKLLSDYMMHLLMMSPFMLPRGIGEIRFQDTRAEAIEFFEGQNITCRDACEMLCGVDIRLPPSQVKGDGSKTLLFDACRLAESLQSLGVGEKWKKITQVWLDMLTFAAAQCSWSDHAEKLGQGGELLTHVWLLMVHFGMTDHFQIPLGFVRAKLNLK